MSLTQPWRRRTFPAIVAMMALAAWGGCAAPAPAFKGYAGPDPPDDEVALFHFGWARVGAIDGRELDPGARDARLLPGKHTIRYGLYSPDRVDTIDMKAGHGYVGRYEHVSKGNNYLWIEDTTTGEVVAGVLPPQEREKAQRSERARVEREVAEHFGALLAAAECGEARAQYDVGVYYLAGLDPVGRRDLVAAYVWYGRAASRGQADAVAVKDRISGELPPEQRAAADRLMTSVKAKDCAAGRPAPEKGGTPGPQE